MPWKKFDFHFLLVCEFISFDLFCSCLFRQSPFLTFIYLSSFFFLKSSPKTFIRKTTHAHRNISLNRFCEVIILCYSLANLGMPWKWSLSSKVNNETPSTHKKITNNKQFSNKTAGIHRHAMTWRKQKTNKHLVFCTSRYISKWDGNL